MAKDIATIEAELVDLRAQAKVLIDAGDHFTPAFESILTSYKVRRAEQARLRALSGVDINIESL